MARIELEISNGHGLHARPAALFVQTASRFTASIVLRKVDHPGSKPINGKSILEVLTSGIHQGARIELEAEGEDAEGALAALRDLVEGGLGDS